MPESECDVCLSPEVTIITADIRMFDGPATTHIRFCRECTNSLFDHLNERYRAAIAEHNAAVEFLIEGLGIKADWREGQHGPA